MQLTSKGSITVGTDHGEKPVVLNIGTAEHRLTLEESNFIALELVRHQFIYMQDNYLPPDAQEHKRAATF